MSVTHLYDVQVAWENDRKGLLSSSTLNQNIEVVTPPEFPKGIAGVWSPEHLFVAAINSCLMTTFLAIAENSKLEFTSFSSDATGKLEMIDGKYLMSEVNLHPKVIINEGTDKEKVERILNKSEAACLISNSVKSKINFFPEVIYN
ncbi:MAG: OsmC family protein [Candidatus Kapabacteria bacterium]|nr:OsmC family protein [Candidatus Kapabacteria bacterium]